MSPVGINGVDKQGVGINGVQVKQALDAANETVDKGVYDATTLSAVDADLAVGNIKSGITLFGFAGVATVQDIADADAVVADVKDPKTFYSVTGARKTGTLATVAIVAANDNYPAGYHAGDAGGLDAIDADLAPANIKLGVTIFGKLGTLAPGITFADYHHYELLAGGATYTPTAQTLAYFGTDLGGGMVNTGIHVELWDGGGWVDAHINTLYETSCIAFQDNAQNLRVHNGGGGALKMSLTGVSWS